MSDLNSSQDSHENRDLRNFNANPEVSKEVISFTLKGVLINEPTEVQTKFVSRPRRKLNAKIQTHVEESGRKIRVAYTGNVTFESESDNQHNMCFWDHHEYDGPLICVPLQYAFNSEENMHRFVGIKSFCRLRCLYAYLLELEKQDIRNRPHWLTTAFQLTIVASQIMYGKNAVLVPSEHWEMLREYGGTLSLEEFRKEVSDNIYVRTPNLRFGQIIETNLLQ